LIAKRGTASKSPARRVAAALLSLTAAAMFLPDTVAAKVPLPRLRPQMAAAAPAPKAATQPATVPIAPATPSRFSAADQQALAHISAYFNSFQTMEGQFIQFGPHGEQSEGTFSIARPGKLRFHFSPPAQLDMISDGHNVAIRDSRLRTQDLYPLSKTPLRYLLANQIDLTSDKVVSQVRRERDLIALIIVDKSSFGQFKLTLIFDPQSYALKQWIVTDPQGLNTSDAIYNTTVGKKPDPSLFTIDYFAFKR
jgi:outer membrane lipoprotein-sorting protein